MLKYLFSFLLMLYFTQIQASWKGLDKQGNEYLFDVKMNKNLDEEHEIFSLACHKVYEEFSEEALCLKISKNEFIEDLFQDLSHSYLNGKMKLITVRSKEKLVGLLGFSQTDTANEIYIDYMFTHPSYWRNGLGKQLIFSIFKESPQTQRLVVVTRKINERARKFYESLGFIESPYMHEGCSPEQYIGYEFILNTIPLISWKNS